MDTSLAEGQPWQFPMVLPEGADGNIQQWQIPMGLPPDPVGVGPVRGLESTAGASQPAPLMTSHPSLWEEIKQDSLSAVRMVETGAKNVYGGIKDITKTVYGDVESGVETVVGDVAKPVQGAIDNAYWKIILAVVVLGGALYYIGKSGALKVNAIV